MSSNFSSPFMAKSPFNNNERKDALIDPDSLAAVEAWDQFKQNYMVREFKGNDKRLGPITPEQNKAEYDREKNEFYYDTNSNKMKLIPTDDAEIRDQAFMDNLKSFQLPPEDKNL
tara:strand:+ start:154 stop:498 length:345 start_codon:yes stop_codon:yes gene_type:complete